MYTDAVLRTFALMDWPYKALAVGYIFPPIIRDAIYKLVAKYRCDNPHWLISSCSFSFIRMGAETAQVQGVWTDGSLSSAHGRF